MSHPIQIILTRQLAGYLSVPTFLVDPNGTLLFYNEPAEVLLGRRFDETGAMPAEEWSTIFAPVDQEGQPIPPAELALMIALHKRRPAHERLFIRGLNGVRRHLEVVAIPILGIQGEFLGAVALFWELGQECASRFTGLAARYLRLDLKRCVTAAIRQPSMSARRMALFWS